MTHPTTISPEDQFEKFRLKYPSIRCKVLLKKYGDDRDIMIYKTGNGFADESVRLANTIIKNLGLGLVAEKGSKVTNDSFIVKCRKK